MLYSCLIFCPLIFFFRSASSCLCRPHRRRNVSQVNLTTETFSLHIFPAYSIQFFFKTPSFSLSPDYRTFVSGACDASAKVKSSFRAQIIIISFSSGMCGMGSASRLSLVTSLTSMLSQWVWSSTLLMEMGYIFFKNLRIAYKSLQQVDIVVFATTIFHVLTTFSFAVLPQWERVRHWVRRRDLQALRHQSWSRAQHGKLKYYHKCRIKSSAWYVWVFTLHPLSYTQSRLALTKKMSGVLRPVFVA